MLVVPGADSPDVASTGWVDDQVHTRPLAASTAVPWTASGVTICFATDKSDGVTARSPLGSVCARKIADGVTERNPVLPEPMSTRLNCPWTGGDADRDAAGCAL